MMKRLSTMPNPADVDAPARIRLRGWAWAATEAGLHSRPHRPLCYQGGPWCPEGYSHEPPRRQVPRSPIRAGVTSSLLTIQQRGRLLAASLLGHLGFSISTSWAAPGAFGLGCKKIERSIDPVGSAC
jgi:hypothetical protein